MKDTDIRVRRCRRADLMPAFRVFLRSMNHLRAHTGKAPLPIRLSSPPPLFTHLHRTDGETFVGAWRGERLVGFAGALVRGKQWYLAWLFVDPRYQDRGVGRRLIERVWRNGPGMTHALSTMTYNQQAVGLYTRFGLVPHELLTSMEADREEIVIPEATGLDADFVVGAADLRRIERLETGVRGYPRRPEWDFWAGDDDHDILIFRRRGRIAGYAVLGPRGLIGPVGAARAADLPPVAVEAFRVFLDTRSDNPRVFCPNSNAGLYRLLHRLGFRNQEMLLFMTDTPYGDFRRYVPATLGLF